MPFFKFTKQQQHKDFKLHYQQEKRIDKITLKSVYQSR